MCTFPIIMHQSTSQMQLINVSGVCSLQGPAGRPNCRKERLAPCCCCWGGGVGTTSMDWGPLLALLPPFFWVSPFLLWVLSGLLFTLLTGKLYNRARSFFNFGILPILTANQKKDILVSFSKAMISITVISCTMYLLNICLLKKMPCRCSKYFSKCLYLHHKEKFGWYSRYFNCVGFHVGI